MTKTPEELTKEWKAGELEDGLYYILLENGKTPISELETWYRTNIEESKEYYETEQAFYGYSDNMISEVLAPIPTYDEYKAMQEQIADASKTIEELELNNKILEKCQEEDFGVSYLLTLKTQRENNNLRDLLRECKQHLYFQKKINNEIITLLVRINAALGESEA